jgi:UDP-glucuronate 4-epimerase
MRICVTGSAGFIGYHLAQRFLREGHEVLGIDALTAYYDVNLKLARHALLGEHPAFSPVICRLEDAEAFSAAYLDFKPEIVVHLAAQAGVRTSLTAPGEYVGSNIVGTFNLLEAARRHLPRHLLIASTSSVYGADLPAPFKETDRISHPLSPYAATKAATEQLSHAYSHIWSIPTTVLRFFTVYGPWGRPDMALFSFVDNMLNGKAIDLYNDGDLERDFTYIDDLVEAVFRLTDVSPIGGRQGDVDSLSPVAPWRVVNIGPGAPVELMAFVAAIEEALGFKAKVNFLPMQAGDVPRTYADATLLHRLTGFLPATPLSQGVLAFCNWRRSQFFQSA